MNFFPTLYYVIYTSQIVLDPLLFLPSLDTLLFDFRENVKTGNADDLSVGCDPYTLQDCCTINYARSKMSEDFEF